MTYYEWIDQVSTYLDKYNFSSSFVFNIDETRSEPRESPSERFVCPDKEGRTPYIPFSDLRTTVNVISADGKSWLAVYIYKDDGTADPNRAGSIPVLDQTGISFFIYYLI